MHLLVFVVLLFVCVVQGHVSICKDGGGPNGTTYASSVAIDGHSNVYTVGSLTSSLYNFPNNLSANIAGKKIGGVRVGLQNTGFILKFNPTTKATVYLKHITLTGDQPSATTDSIVFGNNKLYITGTLDGHANVFGCNINSGGVYIARLDLDAKCEKATVIHSAFVSPYLLADSVTGHLYVYGSNVYGNVTFGNGPTFPFSDVQPAVFIAQLSWLESYEWIVRIASKGPEGDYQTISAIGDIGQDNTHIYALVQASNSLEFCDINMHCTTMTLNQNANVVIKISKADGSHSATVIEADVPPYLESVNIAARSTSAGTEVFIGGLGTEATVTKYNSTFDKQWVATIPNECCSGYRNVESYTTALRFDHSGNIYAAGTTLTGSGARFSVSQPFVAKVKNTNGKVLFNTRAGRDVTNPPDPYSGSTSLAVDTTEGEAYLVGNYGCTLEWGTTNLSTPSTNCGTVNTRSGRNTYMFIVSVNTASGAGC